jgi:hypothetical protein
MDSKELRGLMESYSEVYAPQEVDEATDDPIDANHPDDPFDTKFKTKRLPNNRTPKPTPQQVSAIAAALKLRARAKSSKKIDEAVKGASRHDTEMRKADAAERRAGVKNRLSPSKGKQNAEKMERDIKYFDKVTKKTKPSVVGMTHEELDIFDTVLEYLQTEGYENPEQMMTELSSEEIDAILEASYSAKAARAGKDIGKPGKAFAKIAKSAGERYGSKERGEKVAGAVLAKLRAKRG